MTLFRRGDFTLHSGERSSFKVDCDALTSDDLDGLVAMAREVLPSFTIVVGVPRGGLALAEALKPHIQYGFGLLIVDDVYTTGASMEAERAKYPGVLVHGLVIFARRQPPPWIKALWVRG